VTLVPAGRHDAWTPAAPGLVVCDVDGTLVGSDGDVAPDVVTAARALVDAGLPVGVATGRMLSGVARVLARTGLPGPHLVSNGAVVVHEGEVIASWPVPREVLGDLLALAARTGLYVEVYAEDGYRVTRHDERASAHWRLLGVDPIGTVATPDDVPGDVSKVTVVVFDHADVPDVTQLVASVGLTPDAGTSPATPDFSYVNGVVPGADKGNALRTAAERLGVDIAATVALGDSDNDLSMFAVAGTAVAMGQSHDEILAAAHLRAPSVHDDGAAVALRAAADGWRDVRASA